MQPHFPEPQNFSKTATGLAPGMIFAGKFKMLARLGEGGMGAVYLVNQTLLNEEFALKVLHNTGSSLEALTRRFQQEAKTTFSLSHPNLVRVHEFGLSDANEPYLVMEVVDGITLSQYLKTHGPLDVRTACFVMSQIASGLSYAHRMGIVHRDIKPGNIMLPKILSPQILARAGSVKILDFGIAKITGSDQQALTRTGELIGSPLYMSPEQCSGSSEVNIQSDIYSLGCVFYEMLTGTPPHIGPTAMRTMMMHQTESPSSLKEATLGGAFPNAIENIVQKMLEKLPSRRYQTADHLQTDLVTALSTETSEPKVNRSKKTSTAVSRNFDFRSPVVLLIGASLLIAATASITHLIDRKLLIETPLTQDLQIKKNSPDDKAVTAEDLKKAKTGRELDAALQGDNESTRQAPTAAQPLCLDPPRVKEGNAFVRHFVFPEQSLGVIGQSTSDYYTVANSEKPAKGAVTFADTLLTLNVKSAGAERLREIRDHLPDYARLNKDLFVALDLANMFAYQERLGDFLGDDLSSANKKVSPEKEARIAIARGLLRTAATWRNLHVLQLRSMLLDDDCFSSLAKLHGIERIKFADCPLDDSKLAALPLFKTVDHFELAEQPLTEPIKALAGSKKLRALVLHDPPSLTPNDLLPLKSCPKLVFLLLHPKDQLRNDVLQAISELHSLQALAIEFRDIQPSQVEALLQNKNLATLQLPLYMKHRLTNAGIADRRLKFQ